MSYDLSNELHPVEYDSLIKVTVLAWLLRFDDGREIWLPKSRCAISHNDGGKGILEAPAWLLEDKEIHYES